MTTDPAVLVTTELQEHAQAAVARILGRGQGPEPEVWLFGSRRYDLHIASSDVDNMLLVPAALEAQATELRRAVAERLKCSGVSPKSIEDAIAKQTLQWKQDVSPSLLVTTVSGAREQLCITAYLRAFYSARPGYREYVRVVIARLREAGVFNSHKANATVGQNERQRR